MRNLLCFQLQVWRYPGSAQILLWPLTLICLVFLLPAKFNVQSLYERQCLYPKEHRQALLPQVILTSLVSNPYVTIWAAEQQTHCSHPRASYGKILNFPAVSFLNSNKEVKKQGKYKNQGALLWIHTWDSYSLKWDVYLCISEGIIRYSSYCEMSSYCRTLILSQIWMQTLKLCKSKSFVLAYYTTRRLLEGFQNLEVFEASSCLFQYWWCGRRKGKPCVWMAQSFPFYMWLDTEMLCHAAETLFSFDSISRWDIAPSPQTQRKTTKHFQLPKDFQVQFKALTKTLGCFWFYPTLFAEP